MAKKNTKNETRKDTARLRVFSRRQLNIVLLAAATVVIGATIYLLFRTGADKPAEPPPVPMTEAQRVLLQAGDMIAAGQTQSAVRLLQSYIQRNPDDTNVRQGLANLHLAIARQLARVGQDAATAEQLAAAGRQVKEILRIAPNHAEALWTRGILADEANPGDGEEYYRKAADQPDAGAKVWGSYGLMMADRHEWKSAGAYLQKALRAGSEDGRVLLALGKIAFDDKRFDDARRLLGRAVVKRPFNAQGWLMLAEVQRNSGQVDEAFDSLKKAEKFARGPERGLLLMQLAQVYVNRRQWSDAAGTFAKASDYPAVTLRAAVQAAKCYYFVKNYALAMKYIDRAWELADGDKEILRWKNKIEDARFGPTSKPAPAGHQFRLAPGEAPVRPDER